MELWTVGVLGSGLRSLDAVLLLRAPQESKELFPFTRRALALLAGGLVSRIRVLFLLVC